MIEYNPKIWFRHMLQFHKTDTLRRLWQELLIMAAYTAGLVYVATEILENNSLFQGVLNVHSILGFAFSLLLVFRINSAYDRWWEGRKHWGALVNNTRNLALRINASIPKENSEIIDFFNRMIPNYAYACKEHLRSNFTLEELDITEKEIIELKNKKHLPNAIASLIYQKLVGLNRDGLISNEELILFDQEIKNFTDIIGACERIKNTPIPYSYSLFLKKFIVLFVFTAPLGFIPFLGYWTIPFAMIIFYVFVSLELIAEEIEDPFGRDPNDLPTDKICKTIRGNVNEIFGN